MKIKISKQWKKFDQDFNTWWHDVGFADWSKQKRWLSIQLVERNFINKKQLPLMWKMFINLTKNCSEWEFQNKILFLIIMCLDRDTGEDLGLFIK